MTNLLDRIDRPQDLHGLSEDERPAGRAGGAGAADRHGRRDRRALRRQPRRLRDRRRCPQPARVPARQGRLGRRPPGLPAQGPHRPPRPAADDPQVRRPRPFCSIAESEHDIMGAGHASTAIGYAVGLKEAMRHGSGKDGKVVAVVGDGAMTGGVAFEAVHQAGGLGTPVVVILNDNGMSIAPNVGALSPLLQPRPARAQVLARARAWRRSSRGSRRASARGSSASARRSRSRSRRCGRSPACGGRSSTGPTWA